MRAPFQILVYLYRVNKADDLEYAVFQRADAGFWQGIAGGGEDDETPLETAMRETEEETGMSLSAGWIRLQTISSVPVTEFSGRDHWPVDLHVVPVHCFGVAGEDAVVTLSHEHTQMQWLSLKEAQERVKFDVDRVALWELDQRLQGKAIL